MHAEVFGLLGIIIILLFFFSETGSKAIIGVFASLLMLMVGVWAITEPITFKIAEHTTGTETIQNTQITDGGNTTSNSIKTYNVSINSTYEPPEDPSYTPLSYSGIIGTVLVLLSMFGMLHYSLRVGKDING